MLLWISGPTGSGKTSLARILAHQGFEVVQERLPAELFHAFAADPSAHCAALQEQIMQSRFTRWSEIRDHDRVVFDRSIDEDLNVFCRLHHERGNLTSVQLESLNELARTLQSRMPSPDLILFLLPERQVLFQRVTEVSHPRCIVDSLDQQLALYMGWITQRDNRILKIDNSRCDLTTLQRFLLEQAAC